MIMIAWPAASEEQAAFQYRGGAFGELIGMPMPDHVGVLFAPSLLALIFQADHEKGAPLDRQEFESFRAMAPAMMMDKADIRTIEAERGGMPNDFSYEDYLRFREER